jgi:predicted small secreted protein
MRKTRPLVAMCALALAALVLAACNTVEGFGEDVENAGKAIQGE